PTSAAMGISIFIDSRITTSWPGTTASPGFTSTFQTVPAMLARIIASRPPPPTSAPQLPGDDQPLDLAGALADLGELRIPPVAGDRQVLHVAGPAVDLDRLVGRADRGLGGEQLRHRRLPGERPPLVLQPGGLQHHVP